jgi:hypothetical protein
LKIDHSQARALDGWKNLSSVFVSMGVAGQVAGLIAADENKPCEGG